VCVLGGGEEDAEERFEGSLKVAACCQILAGCERQTINSMTARFYQPVTSSYTHSPRPPPSAGPLY
jgi:hypothetical protein